MRKAEGEPFLDRARDAMGSGAWHEAYDLLSAADAEQEPDAETLPMLADAAYVTGHPEVSVDVWERIHGAAARRNDPMGAAGAAVRVCFVLLEAGLTAQTRGWVRRAERLLEGQPETPIHGALAVAQVPAPVVRRGRPHSNGLIGRSSWATGSPTPRRSPSAGSGRRGP